MYVSEYVWLIQRYSSNLRGPDMQAVPVATALAGKRQNIDCCVYRLNLALLEPADNHFFNILCHLEA